MAELHENQIAFQAGDTAKANIAAPKDYLSEPMARVADIMDRYADTLMKAEDVELAQNMANASDAGLVELERYEPSDNNYEPAKQKYMSTLQATLMNSPEAARRRFMAANPHYMDSRQLAADNIVFKKQTELLQTKVNNLIPQMASNVVEGRSTYEQEKLALETLLADTDNVFAERKMFEFNDYITKGNIQNMILAGRYNDALSIISDPAQSPTLTPTERSQLKGNIQRLEVAAAEERERLRKELEKKSAGKDDDMIDTIVADTLQYLDRDDDTFAQVLSAYSSGSNVKLKNGLVVNALP